ncbi:MAG: UvrD-helicase domain-containing protein, partial [Alphaproteobacteria bacterium]
MTQIISGQALSAAARQQAQAQDTSRSAWVAASAGAGKTRVLSSRILRLLIEGEEPQGILALTYTRAAATEMANRVIEAARDLTLTSLNDRQVRVTELLGLGPDESPNQEVLDRANRLYEYILETPGGLQIQTIHSFCQSLLGRFPFEAGLTPGFKVIEDEERQHILASVAAFALSKSEPSLTTLKATVRDDAIVPLVSALVDVDWDNLDVTDRLEKFDQYLGGGFENYNVKKHQREFSSKLASRRKAISHLASLAADSAKPGDQKLSNTLFEALESRDALSILSAHFLTEGRLKKTGIHTRALNGQDVLEWLKSAILKYHSRVHSQKLFDL